VRRFGITILFVSVLILAGCAKDGTTTTNPTPTLTALPTLTVKRTGGIAGVNDTWTIQPTGEWTHTDKTGASTHGVLTSQQLTQLGQLAAAAALAGEANRSPVNTQCRDAFNYEVMVATYKVLYVDCPADGNLPTAAKAVVTFVTGLTP
jgi:hypothetical protein